jgi:hypothetical protein
MYGCYNADPRLRRLPSSPRVMSIPNTLSETVLYRRLQELADEPYQLGSGQRNRRAALALVDAVTEEAVLLMGRTALRFPEYTLHDEVHLRRVTHLMGVLLQESNALARLSYIEITLLILAAYLHDVGMVPAAERVTVILDSDEYLLFRAGKREERVGLRELEVLLANSPHDSVAARYRQKIGEIESGLLTEYLRINHGEAGWKWIRERYIGDPRWVLEGQNVADLVAWICRGHAFHPYQLTMEYRPYFPVDKLVGQTPVNILYCTLILRVADILDFDRERTPTVLFDSISPRSEVSIQEWNKHRSITGWKISRDRIVFQAECTHPAYEKALREFVDGIDSELQAALNIVRTFPSDDGISERYRLTLPPVVDRSGIGAKDSAYTYVDLAFTLSPHEIMKLLMGAEFWGGASLAVRELIQNAYDAIRHRQAVERAAGNEWSHGKIILRQRLNEEGRLEVTCEDNGIGMTKHHLETYFFRVGKSYYRSPEFERERAGLKGKGADFDPVSHFGLGVVSTFMIGERLHVHTQRFLGPNLGCGECIEVSVEGPTQLVVMRVIVPPAPSPGTRVTVVGPKIVDQEEGYDTIRLFNAARYFATALEVPVEIYIEEPFEPMATVVPPPARPLTVDLQTDSNLPPTSIRLIQKDIAEILPDSEGRLGLLVLLDDNGRVVLENAAVRWQGEGGLSLQVGDEKVSLYNFENQSALAQDGIRLEGDAPFNIPNLRGWQPAIDIHGVAFFINLRGSDKLPLLPNRRPYPTYHPRSREEELWASFKNKIVWLLTRIFEEIVVDARLCPAAKDIWSLCAIYGLKPKEFTTKTLFNRVSLPILSSGNNVQWLTFRELRNRGVEFVVLPKRDGDETPTYEGDTAALCVDCKTDFATADLLNVELNEVLRRCTSVSIAGDQVRYRINSTRSTLSRSMINEQQRLTPLRFQKYDSALRKYVVVWTPLQGVNAHHPVGEFLFKNLEAPLGKNLEAPLGELSLVQKSLKVIFSDLVWQRDYRTREPDTWSELTCHTAIKLATLWERIQWDRFPSELMPPYRILYPDLHKEVEVTTTSIQTQAVLARQRLQVLNDKR